MQHQGEVVRELPRGPLVNPPHKPFVHVTPNPRTDASYAPTFSLSSPGIGLRIPPKLIGSYGKSVQAVPTTAPTDTTTNRPTMTA